MYHSETLVKGKIAISLKGLSDRPANTRKYLSRKYPSLISRRHLLE